MSVIEDEFPDFYHRGDAHSVRWQVRYLWSERIQLLALLLAVGIAALGGPPFPVVLLFGLALVAQAFRLISRGDEMWWNARLPELNPAKTASWLFVLGGEPFDAQQPPSRRRVGLEGASEVAREGARLDTGARRRHSHVTTGMRSIRGLPRAGADRGPYLREQIRSQRDWYATKSEFNETRSTAWSSAGIAASGLALGFGIAAAVYEWSLDVVGFFSAVGASFVAWMAVKQYQTLARSYAVA